MKAQRKTLSMLFVLSCSSFIGVATATEPLLNGPPGRATFAKYVIVGEMSVNSKDFGANNIPFPTFTITYIHTYDPEMGLVVTSYGTHHLSSTASSGYIDSCKNSEVDAEKIRTSVMAYGLLLKTNPAAVYNLPASKAQMLSYTASLVLDIQGAPIMSCNPRFSES